MADDSETSIKIYLREIRQTSLLTPREEIEIRQLQNIALVKLRRALAKREKPDVQRDPFNSRIANTNWGIGSEDSNGAKSNAPILRETPVTHQ